jgi:2-polyprenyl-3-methyl-5-hydroxy-6-metoxy-1,4-benzoquinol methylase
MTHDDRRERWNERHRNGPIESADPNPVLADVVAGWTPGSALDVACGDGANAVWLARRGWRVTAVDWSDAALAKGRVRADNAGVQIDWVEADLLDWTPPGTFDLVTIIYLHLPPAERAAAYEVAVTAVAPGGRLVIVGHDRTNLSDGAGGPQDPDLLFTTDELAASLTAAHPDVSIERADTVPRGTPAGRAPIDAVLVARR